MKTNRMVSESGGPHRPEPPVIVLVPSPLWVKMRNTLHEQMSSALPPRTDVGLVRPKTLRYGISIAQDFRFVPIAIVALARTDERRHHDVFA